jgi:hypothetical protein
MPAANSFISSKPVPRHKAKKRLFFFLKKKEAKKTFVRLTRTRQLTWALAPAAQRLKKSFCFFFFRKRRFFLSY